MTISTTASSQTFIGNGSTTMFAFSFVADNASDLEVSYTDISGNVTLLNPSVYSVSITSTPVGGLWGIGGIVTYPLSGSAIAASTTLTVTRAVPYTQDISISNQGAFYPAAVEQGLDVLELQIQQLNTDVIRSIKVPVTDLNPPTDLPSATLRALKYFIFDSSGNPAVASSPSIIVDPTLLTVTNIAALKALTPSITLVGTVIAVSGYLTASDGGGGLFLLTNSSPGADNGGTIIWSNTSGYYYTRQFTGAIDARWFGCVGSANCAVSMGKAVAAAAGNTLIIVGDHTYNVSTGPITLVSNINIVGLGNPTIYNTYTGVLMPIPDNAHDITFNGITFDGVCVQHIGTNANSNATKLRFLNCNFTGVSVVGSGVYNSPIVLDTVSYVYVDKCNFYGNGIGLSASSDNNDLMFSFNGGVNDHIFITNSTFLSTQVSIHIAGFNVGHYWVDGCECAGAQTFPSLGAGGYGILAYSASLTTMDHINIRNNFVHDVGGSGIYMVGTGSWVNVENNIVDRACLTQLDVSLPSSAISLADLTIFSIVGNTITNSVENGITVVSTNTGNITGNSVYNSTKNQIYLRGACTAITVSGNSCSFGHGNDVEITNGISVTIIGNSLVSGGRTTASIHAVALNDSIVSNNVISGAYRHGILVEAGNFNTLNQNNISDSSTETTNSYDGINNASAKTTISGNSSCNTGSTGARWGVASSGNYCTISDNLCLSNKTAALHISGTNPFTTDNRVSTDPIKGSATLSSGTVTVSTTEVLTGDMILLECTAASGTQGIVRVSTITNATSFVLTSSEVTDASTYTWSINH